MICPVSFGKMVTDCITHTANLILGVKDEKVEEITDVEVASAVISLQSKDFANALQDHPHLMVSSAFTPYKSLIFLKPLKPLKPIKPL